MSKSKGLSPQDHLELGRVLKRARRLLHEAAGMTRGKLSAQFVELADAIPTGWLEERLVELVGADGEVEGIPVRDVYRGEMEEVDG
jgi:hypothetical protein